jgi:cell division protein FtsN
MATRDDGEFELVLGNKQLFSVLFIVIILLGVFFTMGFLAGRSTGGASTVSAQSGKAPVELPASVDSSAPPSKASKASPAPMGSDGTLSPPPGAEQKKAATPEPPKREPAPAPPPQAATGFTESPAPGTYLQIAATTSRSDADAMLALLGRSGLKGCLTPAPKSPDHIRVLVGPLGGDAAIASARNTLKDLGIDKPYLVKY